MNKKIISESATILDSGVQQNVRRIVPAGAHFAYTFAPRGDGSYVHTFELERESILTYYVALTRGHSVSLHLKIILRGQRSNAEIKGLYVLSGDQKVSIKTEQIHCGASTQSTLKINGALSGTAYAEYHGMIHIAPSANGAQAAQENKNIVLSNHARVQSVPSLEVLANDVHCTHGSAIGYLDQEQLWYMQARGLHEAQARRLLLEGFFATMLPEHNAAMVQEIKECIEKLS